MKNSEYNKLRKSPISTKQKSLFSLSTGVTGYFHDISRYIHEIHDLHGIYMKFSILFVFFPCRAPNLAENKTNLAENQNKKTGFRRTNGTRFLQVFSVGQLLSFQPSLLPVNSARGLPPVHNFYQLLNTYCIQRELRKRIAGNLNRW